MVNLGKMYLMLLLLHLRNLILPDEVEVPVNLEVIEVLVAKAVVVGDMVRKVKDMAHMVGNLLRVRAHIGRLHVTNHVLTFQKVNVPGEPDVDIVIVMMEVKAMAVVLLLKGATHLSVVQARGVLVLELQLLSDISDLVTLLPRVHVNMEQTVYIHIL